MPFTTTELADHLEPEALDDWEDSNLGTQGPLLGDFDAYFAALLQWIRDHGGTATFGWVRGAATLDLAGLTRAYGVPFDTTKIPLCVFTDVFFDLRRYRRAHFNLKQAAISLKRLAAVLRTYP